MMDQQNYRRVVRVKTQNNRENAPTVAISAPAASALKSHKIEKQKSNENTSGDSEQEQYDIFCKVSLVSSSVLIRAFLYIR